MRPSVLVWYWGRRGGGARYTLELTRALSASTDLALHVSFSRQCEIFSELASLRLPGWHIDTYLDAPSAAFRSLSLPAVRHRFWDYVESHGIDVLVSTMSHLWNVPVLWRHRRRQVRFLLALHDALPHAGDDVWMRRWLLKQEVKETDGVVTLTEHVRRLLCREHDYPADRTWVIPHGIFSYAAARTTAARDGRSAFRVLFFGRILPYKGLDLLLAAVPLVRRAHPHVEFVIAGPGDIDPYTPLLKVDGVRVDNRWILEDEIADYFLSSDLVVLPYREASQSGVIATAYAAGLPVVATPIGGLVEQVKHESSGLVAASTTPAALADAISRMIEQPDLYRRCAEGARREAREALAWPVIARQFAGAINKIVAMPMRRGG